MLNRLWLSVLIALFGFAIGAFLVSIFLSVGASFMGYPS